jgi:hypothetical protein
LCSTAPKAPAKWLSEGEGKLRNVAPWWRKVLFSASKLSTFTPWFISVDRKLEEKYFQILLVPEAGKQSRNVE